VRRLADAFPLAIASGSLSREIHDALSIRDLAAQFRAIVGADNVKESKPAPDSYLEAARRLKLPPSRCVAIEDSPWGLESASVAGARTIGITHTYPATRLTGADRIISSLDELTPEFVRALIPQTLS
jgi:beta-phosphoglucomutase-like phosphatase (HAD superfamily)